MQTSLARRQRRRYGAARRPRGGSAARRVLIAIPFLLFGTLILAGLFGLLAVVSAYAHYSEGLPDPKQLLSKLTFDQQTVIYDRTGKIELARLGDLRRELVTYDEIPPEVIDATTATEDKTFWENAGFDPVGIVSAGLESLNGRERGASTITQQLVRARLLPKSAFEGTRYDRKVREIIQSIRLTQQYPGLEGKQAIITTYLNQNFYGNQSYGVKAAAEGYFNKPLSKLTLAEAAVLAAIPQSPTKFDLRKNAIEECTGPLTKKGECRSPHQLQLVVPSDTEIYQRRNYVLGQMAQYAVLTRGKHTTAEYEAAKTEPIILARQRPTEWKAPHFVWQVREQLASILCPGDDADKCEQVDTGGYRVATTLNYKMQGVVEKWVEAASRAPNSSNPRKILRALKIPASQWSWILGLRGHNIHNGAGAVIDYRTGEVLAYNGSGDYKASKGNRKFQPQFDVLSDGWRQPGSAIKPVNYAIGIDDKTMTAATMFMDVVTDFGGRFTPKQADDRERGPVRLRQALEFSLNIPSIKAGLVNGLEHFFDRSKAFGLRYTKGAIPVTSMGIGTLEVHPIDLLGAYGTIANGGVLVPRTMIRSVVGPNGEKVAVPKPKTRKVISAQAAYIITDILAGNTDPSVNPYWGEWAIRARSGRRPAAYKTGTTNDNRDVAAYGYLAPPKDEKTAALAVGVWMGNSDNSPNDGKLSLQTSAPLWSAILSEISRSMPIARFTDSRPRGLVTAIVDAFSGLRPGPFSTVTVREIFIAGTVPTQRDNLRVPVEIDSATGLLWADNCAGPKVTRGFLDFSRAEANFDFPRWQRYNRGWASRAARGVGVRGGPEGTSTMYFYDRSFHPFGANWGGRFKPTKTCTPPAPEPSPTPSPSCDPLFRSFCSPPPEPGPTDTPKPTKRP